MGGWEEKVRVQWADIGGLLGTWAHPPTLLHQRQKSISIERVIIRAAPTCHKKKWQAKLLSYILYISLYILSVSQTSCWVRRWILFSRREEFRIFCRSFDWPIEILTTCPIEDNNISYSIHALPPKLVLFFVLFLSRDIDICMVNGFSQDWHLLVVFASFEELEHSGVFHSSQHFFFLHSEVWAVTLTYEIFLQRKKSRFQKKRKKKVKTFTCVMSCWYT